MASYCGKCGTEVPSGTQFCTACGTPSSAGPVAAVPVEQLPVQQVPVQQVPFQPAPVQAKSGSSALKIVLIVVAIFVGLGILAAGAVGYGVWRVAHRLGVSTNGQHVTMSTSEGTVDFNASKSYSADELGTEIYPGAQSAKGGMKMDLPSGSMITGIFTTSDSKDQVVAFYKGKFGSEASVMDVQDAAIMTVKKGAKESVMVTVTSKDSENDGKTKIAIVHTTNSKPS
jgi:hypothetical protein